MNVSGTLHSGTCTSDEHVCSDRDLAVSPHRSYSAEVFTFQSSFDKQHVLHREGIKPVTKKPNPAALNDYAFVALTPL